MAHRTLNRGLWHTEHLLLNRGLWHIEDLLFLVYVEFMEMSINKSTAKQTVIWYLAFGNYFKMPAFSTTTQQNIASYLCKQTKLPCR